MDKIILDLTNTEAGRFLLGKLGQKPEYPVIKVTKNSFTERVNKKTYRLTCFSRQPIFDLFAPILTKMQLAKEYRRINNKQEAFLHYSGLQANYKYPQIFLASSTFNPAAGANSPVDGTAEHNTGTSQTWSTVLNGAGTGANAVNATDTVVRAIADATLDTYHFMMRGIFLFDASALPAGFILTAGSNVFSLYGTAKSDVLGQTVQLTTSNPAANNTIASSDFAKANFGTTLRATGIAISAWNTAGYNDFTLNTNGDALITAGICKFGTRLSSDVSEAAPTWADSVDCSASANMADAGSNKPKLVVVYTVPDEGDANSYFL